METVSKLGGKNGRRSTDYFRRGDRAVMIEVEDTGCGIPGGRVAKICDPFFSAKEDQGNLGLGLSICQSIIDSHRGTVEVESKPGRGTRVRIAVPPAKSDQRRK